MVVPDLETIVRLYLRALDGALAGEAEAARRHEWITLELLDQMVREESGGEIGKYWKLNPMPAEAFVIERAGREVLNFIESYRAEPPAKRRARPKAKSSPVEVGKFRDSGEVHKWMYDRWSLRRLLGEAGFQAVRVCRADESGIPDFARYQLDVNPDGSIRKPDSLFMEARKP